MRSKLRLRQTVVDGHKIYLDDQDSLSLSLEPDYEGFENALLVILGENAKYVLDIGANIGYNSLRFARLVGEQGKVYAFEPESSNVILLKKNISANGYKNVVIIPKAVANEKGRLNLFVSDVNRGDHRLYPAEETRTKQVVEVVTVDEELRDLSRVDLIKMDIQGSEGMAFGGMNALLNRSDRVVLATEFWPYGLLQAKSSAEHYFNKLLEANFTLFHIDEVHHKLTPAKLDNLLAEHSVERGSHTNLLGIKGPVPERISKMLG